jgi:hypothetical protein
MPSKCKFKGCNNKSDSDYCKIHKCTNAYYCNNVAILGTNCCSDHTCIKLGCPNRSKTKFCSKHMCHYKTYSTHCQKECQMDLQFCRSHTCKSPKCENGTLTDLECCEGHQCKYEYNIKRDRLIRVFDRTHEKQRRCKTLITGTGEFCSQCHHGECENDSVKGTECCQKHMCQDTDCNKIVYGNHYCYDHICGNHFLNSGYDTDNYKCENKREFGNFCSHCVCLVDECENKKKGWNIKHKTFNFIVCNKHICCCQNCIKPSRDSEVACSGCSTCTTPTPVLYKQVDNMKEIVSHYINTGTNTQMDQPPSYDNNK